jgi:hypothetical protein
MERIVRAATAELVRQRTFSATQAATLSSAAGRFCGCEPPA